MKSYVLYHGHCWDGFCAAWIAHKVLGDAAEYIPMQYGQPEPTMECGSVVYLLDFSLKRRDMQNLLSQMHKVIVLDHHKTAEAELVGLTDEFVMRPDLISNPPGSELPIIHFDMEHSGGRLAWEHFFCAEYRRKFRNPDDLRPWLVDYTEDRDLWRWALPYSREINAYIRSFPLDFALWDKFSAFDAESETWLDWARQGEAILRRESQIIDDHIRHARNIEFDGHMVRCVNATVLFSDIAGKLAEGNAFGACYFDRGDGRRQWSLRSTTDGVDVSEVAKKRGGGGHRNAAGFEETATI